MHLYDTYVFTAWNRLHEYAECINYSENRVKAHYEYYTLQPVCLSWAQCTWFSLVLSLSRRPKIIAPETTSSFALVSVYAESNYSIVQHICEYVCVWERVRGSDRWLLSLVLSPLSYSPSFAFQHSEIFSPCGHLRNSFFYLWAICPLSWLYCYKHRGIHRMQGIRLRSENTWETSQNKKRMSNQRKRSRQLYQYYTNGDLMFFNGHSHTHRHTQRKIMNDHFDQTLPNVFMCRITMKTTDRAVQSGGILSNEQAVCWLCSLCGWSN